MHDAVLIARILDGELSLFGQVVRRYDQRVRQLIQWSVRDSHAQEDLVQQTFYLAFRRLEQLRDPRQLESWLLRIARNCAADHLRRQNDRMPGPLPAEIPAAEAPADAVQVWAEVRRLPAEQREVLELRYQRGLSYEQIASRLQVPASTVRGRVYQARKALRAKIESAQEE